MSKHTARAKKYEARHIINMIKQQARVRAAFYRAIGKVAKEAAITKFINSPQFRLEDYPRLLRAVDEAVAELGQRVEATITQSMEIGWRHSTEKTGEMLAEIAVHKRVSALGKEIISNRNKSALEAFKLRRQKGLKLSKRVWNLTNQFRSELEQTLFVNIASGKGAKNFAPDLKKYLNEPDKLFRRVRDAKGKLVLSKPARKYHPSQGVYRSSYKNAYRLARTEVNIAYRSADVSSYKALPFVIGYEVLLSNAHPEPDICDDLRGKYPKTFVFVGWHPNCLCFVIPILATDEEFEKFEDALASGKSYTPKGQIVNAPQVKRWWRRNAERAEGWASTPYFIRDNPKYFA